MIMGRLGRRRKHPGSVFDEGCYSAIAELGGGCEGEEDGEDMCCVWGC